MHQPLISILIPFKNTAEFLPECLQSIINQSYKNWELLIVDDGSTDESFKLVEKFINNDSRIQLFKNNGSGIISALRIAFSKSKGELITRMDSDDIMLPNKLEVLSNKLIKHKKKHVAIGLVKYFSKTGIGDGYSKYETWINSLTLNGTNYSEIYKECVIPSPCWMIHREDLVSADAFNPNRYPEDYDLTFRFYENSYTCIPCTIVLHHWRDYAARASRTNPYYAHNFLLNIKLHYFLKLDYNNTRPLTLWGAGDKGKTIAKTLIENEVPFDWICDNPKKIGHDIYGVVLKPFRFLKQIKNPQSIITVANTEAQKQIRNYLTKLELQPMKDYFFFC
ncbi:glycosyltransferase family 2 protein [Flavobacteriaceae bacterium PRS1]|nr:glycosyltransferase family 2 protein [Flavobacteriaceae bacterium PRS1]